MAKEEKPKAARGSGPADAVRSAVEQAFSATAGGAASTRGRAQDLVDDITSAAGRVREALDDLRVLEDIRRLRAEVDALSDRVAALEGVEVPKRRSPVPRVPARRLPGGRGPARPGSRGASRVATPAAPEPPAEGIPDPEGPAGRA
jgi:polyhydroxyalkanoate synthesis regulator phasin